MAKRFLRALALVGALLSIPAQAIELEPIQVRSRLGEPLLAEIRLRDVPPNAGTISARLPDAVVFARTGAARPRGVIAEMRFEVTTAERGTRVIRITTPQPVSEDFLTFLVQLDWSQGSLVREFSIAVPLEAPVALASTTATTAAAEAAPGIATPASPLAVDPASVDAPTAPVVEMPVRASAPQEARAVETEAAPIPVIPRGPRPVPVQPAAEATVPIPVIARADARPRTTAAPTGEGSRQRQDVPAPAPPAPPAAAPMSLPTNAETIVVRRGSHLTGIARTAAAPGVPIESALVALLVANPDAFADGNINQLKQGAQLRMPSPEAQAAIDPARARALVSLHAHAWEGGADDAEREAMAAALADIVSTSTTPRRRAAPAQAEPARMQIRPVTDEQLADASDASTRLPSTAALQREAMASRDAEIEHLQQKLGQLEQESAEQRALIAMQNEALSQAQRHLDRDGSGFGFLRTPWPWLAFVFALGFAWWLWARQSTSRSPTPSRKGMPSS